MSINPEFNLDLIFHHTGLLVKNIEDTVLYYKTIFGENCASEISRLGFQFSRENLRTTKQAT